MKKKQLPGISKKELLLAGSRNRLHNFLLADGQIRGAMVHNTHTVKEMRCNHGLGILETLVLGQAYMGITLMASGMKGNDAIAMKIQCEGPIKGLTAEANAVGEVRGHLKVTPIPLDAPLESWNISHLFGNGFLSVTRFPETAKQPYTGQVKLKYGSIARDLANYFALSEEIPTAFNLSVKFDGDGKVTGAGGLMLQSLPGAGDELIRKLEILTEVLPSIGDALEQGQTIEQYIDAHFHAFTPQILANRRVEFFCRCRQESIAAMLGRMQPEALDDILEHGPFPVEIRCHNCNTTYEFEKADIKKIRDNK